MRTRLRKKMRTRRRKKPNTNSGRLQRDSFDIESHRRPDFPRVTLKLDIALLFSCRQICREAEHTLYATTTFSFKKLDALHAFMRSVRRSLEAKNPAIRKIHLSVDIVLRHEEYA